MFIIRKIKDDGSFVDAYHPNLQEAIAILTGYRGLILDLNKPIGESHSFKVVYSTL